MADQQTESLARYARSQGWTTDTTSKGHVVFESPAGVKIITSGTTSDWRAHKNFLARLRKAGLTPPPKRHKKKDRRSAEATATAWLDGVPYRDIEKMAPYPHIQELFGQWRTDDWFDSDGFPLNEDEWGGPDDEAILAAALLDNGGIDPEQDLRTDRSLRAQFYALKYWGGLEGGADPGAGCVCGLETGSNVLQLANHLLKEGEKGYGDHYPIRWDDSRLREWTEPSGIADVLEEDDPYIEIETNRMRIDELEAQLEDSQRILAQAEESLREINRLAMAAIPHDQTWGDK